ncbi:MAG: VanW family protein [Aeromicrobium sp.]|uniref:VanW family protein n=1 Tax=Aeromicrobium sp. TaxID=1871063 RepID=UPI0039E61354
MTSDSDDPSTPSPESAPDETVVAEEAADDLPPVDLPPPPPGAPSPDGSAGDDEPKKRHWKRWALAAAVVVLGGLYVGGYFLSGSRLPADTTIGGVDVGGLSPAKAESKLEKELGPRENQELTLVFEESEFVHPAQDMGLALDTEGSVDAAGGERTWNPVAMVRSIFGGGDHRPELTVDEAAFGSAHDAVAQSVDVPVTEALITFPEAQPTPTQPADGRKVTTEGLLEAIRDVYLVGDEPVQIPVQVVEPAVDAAGLEQAMADIAAPAVSAPIQLQVGDQTMELPVMAYAPALQVRVEDGAMAPYIDPEILADPLADATASLGDPPKDATIDIVDGAPVITEGEPGTGLHPEETATALLPVLTAVGAERVLATEATTVEPKLTAEDIGALGITEKVSEFSTYYPHAEYRNVNQGRAAELVDGYLLLPGETFSFNDTVGERTEANGFTSGAVINGGQFRNETGGGVSQVVTTLYNAAFFAGLDDDEHHPHMFYIDRYPVGREATVYYGSLDLRFTNPTDHGVLVKAWVNKSTPGGRGEMHVEMWSTKIWDIEASESPRRNFRSGGTRYDTSAACVSQSPIQGFDIDIVRTFKQNGEVVKTETDTAVYQAADHVICGPPPGETPQPTG